jgi:hypothetical protein
MGVAWMLLGEHAACAAWSAALMVIAAMGDK